MPRVSFRSSTRVHGWAPRKHQDPRMTLRQIFKQRTRSSCAMATAGESGRAPLSSEIVTLKNMLARSVGVQFIAPARGAMNCAPTDLPRLSPRRMENPCSLTIDADTLHSIHTLDLTSPAFSQMSAFPAVLRQPPGFALSLISLILCPPSALHHLLRMLPEG